MADLKPRNTQTKVKHEILSRYLETWGSIIISGLINAKRQQQWHFVYVDCFSYLGKYSGEKEDDFQNKAFKTVYGSPILGINALDRLIVHAQKMGVSIRVNTILIEKDKKTYEGLKNTLQEVGHSQRVKYTGAFHELKNGEIALINADSISITDELLAYTTQPNTWAFYLIDPYGPSGIPFDFVKNIVRQEHHDVMINFIYEDLLRKTGICLKESPKPSEKQLIDHWTKAFGSDWWIELARETLLNEEITRNFRIALDGIPLSDMEGMPFTEEELSEVKEQKFVSAYRDVLCSMDENLVPKLVNLRFGDRERTMFYLYLTTHDATGALALNKILYEAKFLEFELRYRLRIAKRAAAPPGQMILIPMQIEEVIIPEPEKPSRPTIEEIGNFIFERFMGKQVTKKYVYKELANTFYFPEEVDKALRYLRRQKLADFDGDPKHKTLITFSQQQQ